MSVRAIEATSGAPAQESSAAGGREPGAGEDSWSGKRDLPSAGTAATLDQSRSSAGESPLLPLLEGRRRQPTWPAESSFVATCVDAHHPTLLGRVKVHAGDPAARWGADDPAAWWLPTLHGLTIRTGDRLLVQRVAGGDEPIVVGVIDGFLPRPEQRHFVGPQLELKADEVLRVNGKDGQALLEIAQGQGGTMVRLLQADTRIDLPGKLTISAAELELNARSGSVRIEASDEVALIGELIQLN